MSNPTEPAKVLTPEELSQYRPEDILPKLQSQFSLDLSATFKRAELGGAVVVEHKEHLGEPERQSLLPKVHGLTSEEDAAKRDSLKNLKKLIKRK